MDKIIKQVGKSLRLYQIDLDGTKFFNNNNGQNSGVWLVGVLISNNTTTLFRFYSTDMLGSMNVKHWGDTLMKMKTLR